MPVSEDTLSDIRGDAVIYNMYNSASFTMQWHPPQLLGSAFIMNLYGVKIHWIMLAGSTTTYAHNRIMH